MEDSTLLKEVKIVLMSFFFSTFEVHRNYEELSVIKIILVLSYGQSAVERSFSLGKSFKIYQRVYKKQKIDSRPYVGK